MNSILTESGQGLGDNFLSIGRYLAEDRWADYCNDPEIPVQEDATRYGLACLLENLDRFIQNLDETTRAFSIGDQVEVAYLQ